MRIDGLHELLTEIMMKEFANFSIRKLLIVARGKQGVQSSEFTGFLLS